MRVAICLCPPHQSICPPGTSCRRGRSWLLACHPCADLVQLVARRGWPCRTWGKPASRCWRRWRLPFARCRPAGPAGGASECLVTMATPSTTTLPVLGQAVDHLALLALVLAGDDNDLILGFYMQLHTFVILHYSTSGARDTIFMKSFSRSSRATGPKIRVPRGIFWSLMITAALSSKRM